MHALVTGGAGFIGSTLVDRLLGEGHSVLVIDDLSSGNAANLEPARAKYGQRLTFEEVDIRSPRVVEVIADAKPEMIFHLAAQVDVRVSVADPVLDAEINIIGSLNVLEGARRAGSRKISFASSGGTIYGDAPDEDLPFDESQPQRPVSPYGVAKRVVTDYLAAYESLHDLRWTSLALANVFGPRQNPHGEAGVVAIFGSRLLSGQPCTIYGDGSATRDYVYVDDVVDGFMRSIDQGEGLYNIGTGVETSTLQLYEAMAREAGVDGPPILAPSRVGELQRSALDAGRAKRELGWVPQVDIAEGSRRVLEFIRNAKS